MRRIAHPRIVLLSVALISIALPAGAHHGAFAFDPSKEVTLQGVITQFTFSNPHVQIGFDVTSPAGETAAWQGELPAPNTLLRAGWNRRTLKPGDRVTITGFQAWRGERVVWVKKIVGPDGRAIPFSP